MTFVDNHQIIFWEKVEQAIRTLARLAAIEIARIVLDARTMPQLFHHFHVILHPFLNTLGLNAVAKFVKKINLFNQIVLNTANGMLRLVFRGDEKVGGIYLIIVKTINAVIGQAVHFFNAVYLIIPPCDAQKVVAISHSHVYGIAFHTKVSALQVDVVTNIERVYQLTKKLVAVDTLPL